MVALTIFLLLALIVYLQHNRFYEAKDIIEYSAWITGFSAFLVWLTLFLSEAEFNPNIYHLVIIPLLLYGITLFKKAMQPTPLNILANQQRYFEEVNGDMVYSFYKTRKDLKKNRVEVLVNKDSKKLLKNNHIVPQFFMDLKDLKLTEINNLEELENIKLYKALFKKVKGFINDREVKENYEETLKKNKNIAEYFLMDLWERYTDDVNIGVANLQILADNDIQRELLGALDIINLNCVKRNGAVLYYKYIKENNRIESFAKIKDPQQNDPDDNQIPDDPDNEPEKKDKK